MSDDWDQLSRKLIDADKMFDDEPVCGELTKEQMEVLLTLATLAGAMVGLQSIFAQSGNSKLYLREMASMLMRMKDAITELKKSPELLTRLLTHASTLRLYIKPEEN